jgi:hypothetical protein
MTKAAKQSQPNFPQAVFFKWPAAIPGEPGSKNKPICDKAVVKRGGADYVMGLGTTAISPVWPERQSVICPAAEG